MSEHLIACLARGAAFAGAEWLRDELARGPAGIPEAIARFGHLWRPEEWTIEERVPGQPNVVGPGGFSIRIGDASVEVYRRIPFYRGFASDAADRDIVRRGCFAIATLVGSPRAIYHHELLANGFDDGLDLDAMEAHLRATIGAPATSYAELAASDAFGPGCWIVDDFTDLRAMPRTT